MQSWIRTDASVTHDEFTKTQDEFTNSQALLKSQASHLDSLLLTPFDPTASADVSRLTTLRRYYLDELNTAKDPVSLQPFYQHILMYFWPTMYFCLGVAVLCLKPAILRGKSWHTIRATLLLTICIFAFNVALIWIRNFYVNTIAEGRIVYAYSNWDIARWGFVVQQFNFLLFSFLLAILWQQWSAAYVFTKEQLAYEPRSGRFDAGVEAADLQRVSDALLEWQSSFVLISIGFMLYTAVFWSQIVTNGDLRFVPEAIVAHILWVITTFLMAMPFWTNWRTWRWNRLLAVSHLVQSQPPEADHLDAKLVALSALKPIGAWNASAFALSILSSFAIPLLQALLRRP